MKRDSALLTEIDENVTRTGLSPEERTLQLIYYTARRKFTLAQFVRDRRPCPSNGRNTPHWRIARRGPPACGATLPVARADALLLASYGRHVQLNSAPVSLSVRGR